MDTEFAYSLQAQILLAVVTFTEAFCSMTVLSNLILTAFDVSAGRRQKLIFTLITGTLLQNVFAYAVYLLGGMLSFSSVVYSLVVNLNPLFAMIYYYSAIWLFKLSSERSVKLMSYLFICWALKVAMGMLLHAVMFAREGPRYNYLLDATQQVITLALFYGIRRIVQGRLSKSQLPLRFSDNMFFNKRRELLLYLAQATFIYGVSVLLPMAIPGSVSAYLIVLLVLLLLTVANICRDVIAYNRQVVSNCNAHISALFKGTEELLGIKHDFNNILHTYSGYLELKEYQRLEAYHASLVASTSHAGSIMELARKLPENPPVISLLIKEMERAERSGVKMLISIKCNLSKLYIDDMDISRILSHLLDSAILAASESDQRKVYFTIESKVSGSKLIIVTNSRSGGAGSALGLPQVRSILSKYGNCSYHIQDRNQEATAYVELCEAACKGLPAACRGRPADSFAADHFERRGP